jgi:hypothetical protein
VLGDGDATHLVAEEVDLLESVVGDTPERVRLVPSCERSASTSDPDDESAKQLLKEKRTGVGRRQHDT